MLAVRFDLDMVQEVNHMIQPELKHLLTLATQWDKNNTGDKVSLRNLLKMRITGRTTRSEKFVPVKMVQTKIPSFFQKNSKRDLPESLSETILDRVVPTKKTKSAPSMPTVEVPALSVVEPDSDFSEEMILNKNIESTDTIQNSQLENTGTVPDKNALASSSEDSSDSDSSGDESTGKSSDGGSSGGNSDAESVRDNGDDDGEGLSSSNVREQVIDVLDSDVGRAVIDSVG